MRVMTIENKDAMSIRSVAAGTSRFEVLFQPQETQFLVSPAILRNQNAERGVSCEARIIGYNLTLLVLDYSLPIDDPFYGL